MNRKQLTEKLFKLQDEVREVRKQIDAIDYNKRLSDAVKYQGRCFKSLDNLPRYIFVYDICKTNCEPISIDFYHFKDGDLTTLRLETNSTFFPCDPVEWVEIPKDEFMEHYSVVKEELNKIVKP